MKHFIDSYSNLSKQTFDTAIIVDSKGKQAGKIIVRYTNSQIGCNNQTGVIFYPSDLNFEKTEKGSSYNQDSVYTLLSDSGCSVYSHGMKKFTTYGKKEKNCQMSDSVSNV